MPEVIESVFVMVAVGEFLVGGLANGFIGVVNFIDWIKTGKVYSMDLILTALAISRILLLGSIMSISIVFHLFLDFSASGEINIVESIWNLSNHLNAWIGTCLSFFYFIKIANFSHPAFLWLKWRINKVVLGMIFICFLIALIVNILLTEKMHQIYKSFAIHRNETKGTHKKQTNKSHEFFNLIFYYTGGFVPFIVSLFSCFLLVFSLWRHIQEMQRNATMSRNSSTEVHKKTMKSMVSFLVLFILYHVSIFMGTLSYILFESHLLVKFSMIITSIYPLAHSIILIKTNNKLRQVSLRIFQQFKHYPQGIWKSFCDIG
ncbi:taste receptor type 2 member 7-like [Macrotis lagotis]|uniref:taste receptor type 2 member 7-like n=1 Tax=Macrotis lagotis TaxID=92651 RepID=UPI003D6968D0